MNIGDTVTWLGMNGDTGTVLAVHEDPEGQAWYWVQADRPCAVPQTMKAEHLGGTHD